MKKMSKLRYGCISVIFVLLILHFSSCPVAAAITNGDFSQNPPGYGWTYEIADVYSDSTAWDGNGLAVLRPDFEEETSLSKLYQDNIFLLPNEIQLLFDIAMYKSEDGGETDIFTAMFGTEQYTLQSSDFSGDSYTETVVFDLTGWAAGPYVLSFQLENNPDGIFTSVLIDNVQLIPAPGAFLLTIIGIFSASASRKLKA